MPKILIVEDNVDLVIMIEDALSAENYAVEAVYDGTGGLHRLRFYDYDLVVLDWDLPGLSGIEIVQEVRALGKITPILMLTGKFSSQEKQLGLDSGADDYLTKPFDIGELRSRLRALLRRASRSTSSILKFHDLELDHARMQVTRAGIQVQLLPKEFALLEFLMRNPEHVFSADALLNHVWPASSDASPDGLRMCLARLRKKIDQPGSESLIKTLHGLGYKLARHEL